MKRIIVVCLLIYNNVYGQEKIDWNNTMGLNDANFKTISEKAEEYFELNQEEVNSEITEGDPLSLENYRRWKNFWEYRVGDGSVQNAGIFNPESQYLNMPTCNSSSNWNCLGPDGSQITTSNLGIVTQLTFDPDDQNTLYIGTLNSGIWVM